MVLLPQAIVAQESPVLSDGFYIFVVTRAENPGDFMPPMVMKTNGGAAEMGYLSKGRYSKNDYVSLSLDGAPESPRATLSQTKSGSELTISLTRHTTAVETWYNGHATDDGEKLVVFMAAIPDPALSEELKKPETTTPEIPSIVPLPDMHERFASVPLFGGAIHSYLSQTEPSALSDRFETELMKTFSLNPLYPSDSDDVPKYVSKDGSIYLDYDVLPLGNGSKLGKAQVNIIIFPSEVIESRGE